MGDVVTDEVVKPADISDQPNHAVNIIMSSVSVDVQSVSSEDSGCATNDSMALVNPISPTKVDLINVNGVGSGKKTSAGSLLTRPFTAIVRKLSRGNNQHNQSHKENNHQITKHPVEAVDSDAALSSTALNSVSSLNITSTGGDSGVYGGTLSSANTSQDHLEGGGSQSDVVGPKSSLGLLDPPSYLRRPSPPPSAGKYVRNRFKFLPPPLKQIKKKSSCPSLFGTPDTPAPGSLSRDRGSQPQLDQLANAEIEPDNPSSCTIMSARERRDGCRSAGLTANKQQQSWFCLCSVASLLVILPDLFDPFKKSKNNMMSVQVSTRCWNR